MKKKAGGVLSGILALLVLLAGQYYGLFDGNQAKTDQHATQIQAQQAQPQQDEYLPAESFVEEDGRYTDKDHVAAYLNAYGRLPSNYITKQEAEKLGWQSEGTLDEVAPGMSIGGSHFGNYEGQLPSAKGRTWRECDIDYVRGNRNAKRIVFSNDGLIYYTGDHYETFERMY